ncbi:MAG TPA: cytochrome P450 [Pseudonocardia sp.]|nr:cytochrome P450 [Pseudonocardia sp.]
MAQVPEFRLTDPELMECPYPHYTRAFESGERVLTDPDIGVTVLGYKELIEMSRNPGVFSSELSARPLHMGISPEPIQDDVLEILGELPDVQNALFGADPPAHTRHRKIINQALNPRRLRQLEPQVQDICDKLVAAFVDSGEVDFLPRFAIMLPLTVVSDIVGVRHDDMMVFKYWGEEMIAGNSHVLDNARRREVARALVDFHQYFEPLIEARRAAPTEDLLSWLTHAQVDGEPGLTNPELGVIVSQILLAGHETTTNLIGNALVLLCRDEALQARLRANPGDIPKFVEEVLRWDPPIQCTMRRAAAETEFHGHTSARDQWVVPMWGAGSRDPEVFPDPEVFDIDRPNVRNHLGFGHGIHFCVGSELARMEARIAFETLMRTTSHWEIDEYRSDLTHPPTFAQHGYKKIVLRFTKT